MIVKNSQRLREKIEQFKKLGKEKFHVVADFDRTLTLPFVNGVKIPSVISILRDQGYLSPEYSKEATKLAKHYGAIERDMKIPESERRTAMQEWWTKHFELLTRSGLNRKHLERIVNEGGIVFREGVAEFLEYLHNQQVPLVILSSNGVGDTIEMLLEKERKLYGNIHVITNRFGYGGRGEVLGVEQPIIHAMNKDETSVRDFPSIYRDIETRKNVLLLGDSLGDLGMVAGFKYKGLISVGFLEEDDAESRQKYEESFDVVLTDNASFEEVNKIVREVVGE